MQNTSLMERYINILNVTKDVSDKAVWKNSQCNLKKRLLFLALLSVNPFFFKLFNLLSIFHDNFLFFFFLLIFALNYC